MSKASVISIILLAVVLLAGCKKDTPPQEETVEQGSIQSTPEGIKQDNRPQLTIKRTPVRLRATAGVNGKVIKELSRGEVVYDQGEVSNYTNRIELAGKVYYEPWIKVQTTDKTEGWIFASSANIRMNNAEQLNTFLISKRLHSIFGKDNAARLKVYSQSFDNIHSVEGFASVYKAGCLLRDTMIRLIETKVEIGEEDELPNLFWLDDAFPGFIPQLVAEGTSYYLFADYRQFLAKANQTPGQEDNNFIDICLQVFPEDSIEYFFPVWNIQTWDYGGHSLLGRGIHKEVLESLAEFSATTDLFKEEVSRIKDDLINDITGQYVTYWEDTEWILPELDSIISAELEIFTPEDLIALQARRKHFEEAEKNGIEVNHRSGRYQ